jgi:hypothetical protein
MATSNLPPWWGFALALAGLAVLWFWLPAGQGWLGLALVLGALIVANQDAAARGVNGPLSFLPTFQEA